MKIILRFVLFSLIVLFRVRNSDCALIENDQAIENVNVSGVEMDDEFPTPKRFDGDQLWRISIIDDHERQTVNELRTKYEGQTWMDIDNNIDILLKMKHLNEAETILSSSNLSHVVLIEDLQKAIDSENPPIEQIENLQNRKGHRMTWIAYHRIADIHSYMDYLAKTYPDICSTEIIGHSSQNRPLKIIKISNQNIENRKVWIDGGMHAREWISPAAVTYIIERLTENWDDLPPQMKNIDWYILPVVNPDGYEHTHRRDRLWRKNLSKTRDRLCTGVDLNRNFGYEWGGKGTSMNSCAEIYRGSSAFSEPESQAMSKYMSKFGVGYFKGYLTFHSYGQYILYPWGHERIQLVDHAEIDRIGKQGAANILKVGGSKYTVGNSATTLYPAAGGSDDWAKGVLGVKYSYTIEMGDTGRYGFILPASYIEKNGKEGFAFVETIAKAIAKL